MIEVHKAVLLSLLLMVSCTTYRFDMNRGVEVYTEFGTNRGILSNDDSSGNSNAGFGAGGNSLLGVGSVVTQSESRETPRIRMASGAEFYGTSDQVSSISSIGSTVERVVFIQEWRKLFSRMFDSIDSAVDANVAKNSTDASVEKANIDAGVKETAILNPVPIEEAPLP